MVKIVETGGKRLVPTDKQLNGTGELHDYFANQREVWASGLWHHQELVRNADSQTHQVYGSRIFETRLVRGSQ